MRANHAATTASLTVLLDDDVVFASDGSWLHPLFDLEEFLIQHPIDMAKAEIQDKIIGKAAAFLIVRLRPSRVHGAIMSSLAHGVFRDHGLPATYDSLVDRIDCKTEEILLSISDAEEAYRILRLRAQR